MRLPGPLQPLRNAQLRRFLGARFASLVGNAVAPIALVFAVLDLSGSPSVVGVVLAARSIPQVVFIVFGGVVADRLPRQFVLVASHSVCFLTQAVAAGLLISGQAQVWQLVVIEAVNGIAAAFTFPALAGIMPQIVDRADLQSANALSGMVRNVAVIGGASLGGALVALAGPGPGLAVDAVSYGVAAVLLSTIRLRDRVIAAQTNVLRDLRDGWAEFVSRRWVWVIVLAFGFLNAIQSGVIYTLGPVIADDTFGRAGWGLVLAAQSVGLVVGTTVMFRFHPARPMVAGMLGVLGFAPLFLALALRPTLALLIPCAVVAGVGIDIFGISWETALQQHVPEDRLSRVFSYDALGSFVAIPVGQLAAGPLGVAFGVKDVITIGAVAYVVISLLTLMDGSVRGLRRATATQ